MTESTQYDIPYLCYGRCCFRRNVCLNQNAAEYGSGRREGFPLAHFCCEAREIIIEYNIWHNRHAIYHVKYIVLAFSMLYYVTLYEWLALELSPCHPVPPCGHVALCTRESMSTHGRVSVDGIVGARDLHVGMCLIGYRHRRNRRNTYKSWQGTTLHSMRMGLREALWPKECNITRRMHENRRRAISYIN